MILRRRSRMPRVVFLVLGLLSLAMTFRAAIGSPTQAGPSPNAVFQFQKDNRSHPWLHITADSGMAESKMLRIDPLGIHGLSTADGARLPESITWNRVQRIDEVVTRAGTWKKVGAATLGLLGAGLGNALNPENGGISSLAGLVVFGGAGGYLGARYGSRFRSERNWYVADTTQHEATEDRAEIALPSSSPGADPAVIDVCNRIGRNELFRASGSFGSFRGYAAIAGPDGLEQLRADRHGHERGTDATPPTRITWDQVDRIEMRGGSALRGAAMGGATFGALGVLLGMVVVAVTDGSNGDVAQGAVYGVLLTAPVGIAIGGLRGSAVRRWVIEYQRPPSPRP